jgi:hypothetical protein
MTDALIGEVERTIPFESPVERSGIDVSVLHWLGAAGQLAPAYWSTSRDIWLRQFYIKNDYLKIAVSTFVEKVLAIPLLITADDHSVKAHVSLAAELTDNINRNSGFLKGFKNELAKFITAYLTQDNGAFLLVMGRGKADGPIVGLASGVMHLDSQRCTRTGNPEFPVRYQHPSGKLYALHYTRVLFVSSMPSDDVELFDVGLCAVSRTIDAAQELLDMVVYSQEKLGSRPPRQILYAKQGATLDQLSSAVAHAESKMDANGLARFARTMLIAPRVGSNSPLELELLDLARTPDGFNRLDNTMLCVAVLAAAFGLDMRDLAHAFGMSGQTKADAEVQHHKTKGKGAAQFMADFAEQFALKVLPDSLTAQFDYVDDTQDAQAATITKTRAEARQINLTNKAIDVRTAREQMLDEGELTEQQFEALELADGRLQDGLDVLTLFFSLNEELTRLLSLGVDNPLDVAANSTEDVLTTIDEQMLVAWQRHDTAPNANIKRKARQAMAALTKLRTLYQPVEMPMDGELTGDEPAASNPAEDTAGEEQPVEPNVQRAIKSLKKKQDEVLDEITADYEAQLSEYTSAANDGDIEQSDFEERAKELVAAIILLAFLRGAKRESDDLTEETRLIIESEIEVNQESITEFANDIYAGRYHGDKLGDEGLSNRLALWIGTLSAVYAVGQTHRADNPRFRWQVGPTEHCGDCLRLNGQVHTAEEWRSSGWSPKGRNLECHGYRCQCQFVDTTESTRGSF